MASFLDKIPEYTGAPRGLPVNVRNYDDLETYTVDTDDPADELEKEIHHQNNLFTDRKKSSIVPRVGPIDINLCDPNNGSDAGLSKKCYTCEFCGWKFNLKANMLAHRRRHTGEKPFSCKYCGRTFTQSSLLTVHMRTHTGEKPFNCSVCNRSFSRSNNLRTHMRTHNNEKPYACEYCGKMFIQRVNMELHTRIHTGQKPYRCGVCSRAFTSCSNMRRHWRNLHPETPINTAPKGSSQSTNSKDDFLTESETKFIQEQPLMDQLNNATEFQSTEQLQMKGMPATSQVYVVSQNGNYLTPLGFASNSSQQLLTSEYTCISYEKPQHSAPEESVKNLAYIKPMNTVSVVHLNQQTQSTGASSLPLYSNVPATLLSPFSVQTQYTEDYSKHYQSVQHGPIPITGAKSLSPSEIISDNNEAYKLV